MMKVTKLVLQLTVLITCVTATPVSTTDNSDLPECIIRMDTNKFRCVQEEGMDYLYCNIKATKKCRCPETFRCQRNTYFDQGTSDQQCSFSCVLDDPEAHGRKSPQEWDENMEIIV